MKIKDIIRTLIMSREDFSDHNYAGAGEEPRLMHDNCAFCDAWRAALQLLNLDPRFIDFEAGDKVTLPGGIPGRVMSTDVTVRVEVQNGEHGPWAVGAFSPLDLIARDETPEFTYWAEKNGEGDVWERRESDHMMRVCRLLGAPTKLMPWEDARWNFEGVQRIFGLLVRADKL